MSAPVRVVAVVSFRHSGSTVLGAVLGASASASMVGETDRTLIRRARGRLRCRCGRSLTECSRWSIPPAQIDRWPDHPTSGAIARARSTIVGPGAVARVQRDLWRAATVARGTTLIDTSKHLRALSRLARDDEVELHVVHLVRTAGPTVASSLRGGERSRLREAGALRRHVTGLAELVRWLAHDLRASTALARTAATYRRVDFEHFTHRPDEVTAALCDGLDLERVEVVGGEVDTGELHVVWGNRGVTGGPLRIRPADRSLDGLPRLLHPLATTFDRVRSRRLGPGTATLRDHVDRETNAGTAVSSS